MTDTTYTVHTTRGTISADALTADWPTVTRGRTARLQLWFAPSASEGALVVENGETHTVANGTTETYQYVTVEDGGTVTIETGGTLTVEQSGLYELLQYLDYADAAAYGVGLNHQPWYHEQLPVGADVDSLVLGFEPSADIRGRSVTGLWGLVAGGSDRRNATLSNWQLELEVFVLGEFSDYPNHAAIEGDLQA